MSSKSNRKLKVFHGLVNYGTQAGLFSKELRNQGIDALSVTFHDNFIRQTDIELLYGGNVLQKIYKHSWNWMRRFYWFFRYNTFHFYFGTTLFPKQLDLPFYKLFGKKIVMEYLGYDVQLYQFSIDKYEVTNVRFYKSKEESQLLDSSKLKRLKYETPYLNKQLVCAPCYSEFVKQSIVLPLAIDINEYAFLPKLVPNREILIMHAPTSRGNKGTLYILEALDRLIAEGYKVKKLLVENVSHEEIKLKYMQCDIFVDQILGGWYGTASIEAMALGRPTICFIRESYFKYIDYGRDIPIINAEPSTIYEVLKKTIEEKHLLPEIGKQSRQFIEQVHDLQKITKNLIEIYKSI